MARDPNSGDIYLIDTGNNRIVMSDENYQFILEWWEVGEGPHWSKSNYGIDNQLPRMSVIYVVNYEVYIDNLLFFKNGSHISHPLKIE